MIICKSIKELSHCLSEITNQQKTIGFVPTMGALHNGHISLINTAKAQCDSVVSSIFVNPTQFNDLSDLAKYPRTIDADCLLLKAAKCDIVFIPEINEIYSPQELEFKKQNIENKSWTLGKTIDFGVLDKVMEGAKRPGHFNGVAQVVSKLFRIVNPNKAYFGQKDFQQLAVIRSMVRQLQMNIEIISCPIIRENDGLAMSSRNVLLSPEQRNVASLISKTLFATATAYKTKTIPQLIETATNSIASEPIMQLDYFEIADAETLLPIKEFKESKSAVACIAVKLGNVRLIDNVVLF